MRDGAVRIVPDCASLHPGYDSYDFLQQRDPDLARQQQVARMERSVMRGSAVRIVPDYAALHPGCDCSQ